MQDKISKRTVDALAAEDGKEAVLWDTEIKGFFVRARVGGTKTYAYFYRAGSGRDAPKRTYTIGKHGSPWTADTARKEAKRIQGMVTAGGDPAGEKAAGKVAPTVADLGERFLKEHADTKRKPATAKQYRRLLDQFILPMLGRKKVADVSRQDIMKLHSSMFDTPYQANRVLALVSTLFTFAERVGQRPDGSNPARHVERFEEEARERMLSAEELACLGDALAQSTESPYVVALIKLLVFSGARLGEIQMMRWEWVDFERGEVRLTDHKSSRKTGSKTIHLPAPALDVLANLPRQAGNPYVICGEKPGSHFVGVQRPWQRIRNAATVRLWRTSKNAAAAPLSEQLAEKLGREPTFQECQDAAAQTSVELPSGLSDLRIHDLRHAFASVAASSGMALPIIGKLLGHTQAVTTQRYAHLAADPLKAAAATVAGKIADAMGVGAPQGDVTNIFEISTKKNKQ
jgi:integrase